MSSKNSKLERESAKKDNSSNFFASKNRAKSVSISRGTSNNKGNWFNKED